MKPEDLSDIIQAVLPEYDVSRLSLDSNLKQDIGVNSLTLMMLALAIEDKYGIQFDSTAKTDTIGDILHFIESHRT